jgi:hypothetical protein
MWIMLLATKVSLNEKVKLSSLQRQPRGLGVGLRCQAAGVCAKSHAGFVNNSLCLAYVTQ